MDRRVTLYTGTGGYDLFSEKLEELALGIYRVYMPKKCPRFLKHLFPYKSLSGRMFKRLK